MLFVTAVPAEDKVSFRLKGDCLKAANAKPSPNKASGEVPLAIERKTNHAIIEGKAR